jgi:hypothetical protein
MIRSNNRSEQGQAVVLLAIAFVALLGFTALAIDGGMVYADRRHAQSIADASSLAGGAVMGQYLEEHKVFWSNWTCSGGVVDALLEAEIAAINRGLSNGETLDLVIADGHGVDVVCSTGSHKYIDIITRIKRDTRTSFIQLFFRGPVQNSVEAVTRINPRMPLGGGYALVALNDGACSGGANGATFTGNSAIRIVGGGILSNGCLTGEGNSLTVDADSEISYAGSTAITHPDLFTPAPSKGDSTVRSKYYVPPPDCSQVPTYPAFVTGGSQPLWNLPPGNYPSIAIKHPTVLQGGGLYCLTGNFSVEGSATLGVTPFDGKTGVTIYMRSGSFSTAGSARVNLSAPPMSPDPSPALRGILIYLAEGNTGTAVLTGSSGSNYSGVILAPDGRISALGGTEAIGFNTAFIGKNVDVRGSAAMNISYYGNDYYSSPTSLELSK